MDALIAARLVRLTLGVFAHLGDLSSQHSRLFAGPATSKALRDSVMICSTSQPMAGLDLTTPRIENFEMT